MWDSSSIGLAIAGTILSSASLGWASIIVGALSLGDTIIRSLVVDKANSEYLENKFIIDDFSNVLINDGYEVNINKYLDLNYKNVVNIWADIQYKAKATAMFGDRTKAKIYEAAGLATSSIEWTEYVKK